MSSELKELDGVALNITRSTDPLGQGSFGVVFPGTMTKKGAFRKEVKKIVLKTWLVQNYVDKQGPTREDRKKEDDKLKHELHFLCPYLNRAYGYWHDPKCEDLEQEFCYTYRAPPRRVQCFLVLKNCSHGDLLTYLKKNATTSELTMGRLLRFATHVCEGLNYLTSKGFVHRDLVCRNILIHNKDEQSRAIIELKNNLNAKIADFGCCRNTGGPGGEYRGTDRDVFNLFIHPAESHTNSPVFNAATEVYTFGLFLFELFTCGVDPILHYNPQYRATGGFERFKKDLQHQKLVISYHPSIPECIWAIIRQCTRHTPSERPKVGEILDRLKQLKEKDFAAIESTSFYKYTKNRLKQLLLKHERLACSVAWEDKKNNIDINPPPFTEESKYDHGTMEEEVPSKYFQPQQPVWPQQQIQAQQFNGNYPPQYYQQPRP